MEKQYDKPNASLKLKIYGPHIENAALSAEMKVRPILQANWTPRTARKGRIIAIGINPSRAGERDNVSDSTLTKLCKFLEMYGFDNLTFLNLFSCVSTKQTIDEASATDFEAQRELLESADVIVIAWGADRHQYADQKRDALKVLNDYREKTYCIQNKRGAYPIHPSRMGYADSELVKFPFPEPSRKQ